MCPVTMWERQIGQKLPYISVQTKNKKPLLNPTYQVAHSDLSPVFSLACLPLSSPFKMKSGNSLFFSTYFFLKLSGLHGKGNYFVELFSLFILYSSSQPGCLIFSFTCSGWLVLYFWLEALIFQMCKLSQISFNPS